MPGVPEALAIWNAYDAPPASVVAPAVSVPGPAAPGARMLPEPSESWPTVPVPPSVAAATLTAEGPLTPLTSSVPSVTAVGPA